MSRSQLVRTFVAIYEAQSVIRAAEQQGAELLGLLPTLDDQGLY